MLFAIPAMAVTTTGGLVAYKGTRWAYNEWAGRSAEDDAKQPPDVENEAKQTQDATDEAKDDDHQWSLIVSCGQLGWS